MSHRVLVSVASMVALTIGIVFLSQAPTVAQSSVPVAETQTFLRYGMG